MTSKPFFPAPEPSIVKHLANGLNEVTIFNVDPTNLTAHCIFLAYSGDHLEVHCQIVPLYNVNLSAYKTVEETDSLVGSKATIAFSNFSAKSADYNLSAFGDVIETCNCEFTCTRETCGQGIGNI